MTNYDRIKNMSVEEMVVILFSSCQEYIDCELKTESCKSCIENWLNSECDLPEMLRE